MGGEDDAAASAEVRRAVEALGVRADHRTTSSPRGVHVTGSSDPQDLSGAEASIKTGATGDEDAMRQDAIDFLLPLLFGVFNGRGDGAGACGATRLQQGG